MNQLAETTSPDVSYNYIGWVPCISGTLYFQYTACDGIGLGYLNVNHVELDPSDNQKYRYLVISSNVDWKDVEASHTDGHWNVVLLGSAHETSAEISGKVFLIPAQNDIWDNQIKSSIQIIANLVHDKEDIKEKYTLLESTLDKAVKESNAFGAQFLLKYNGMSFLNFIPRSVPTDENTSFLICRQSYYYIKYSLHKDKHHARAESLTTTHKIPTDKRKIGLILIGDLKRALVTLKRNCDPSDYKSLFAAKGILSYSKSLAMSCKVEGYLSDSDYIAQKAYIDNMGESLEIMGKRIESELLVRAAFNINFRSIGLFIFALLAPFTLLYKDEIKALSPINNALPFEGTNHIIRSLKWFMRDEFHVLYVAITVLLFYFILKKIHLRYGSPNLAIKRFNRVTKKLLDYVLENERSADIFLIIGYIVFVFFVLLWIGRSFI